MRASLSSIEMRGHPRTRLSETTMSRTHSLETFPVLSSKDSKEASASVPSLFPLKRKESTLSKLVTSEDRHKKFSMQSGKSSLLVKDDRETNSTGTADDESSIDSLENDIIMLAKNEGNYISLTTSSL